MLGHFISAIIDALSFKLAEKRGKKIRLIDLIISPSIKLTFLLAFIALIVFLLFKKDIQDVTRKNRTKKELSLITKELEKYHSKYKIYPNNLKDIINSSPLKKTWIKDAWQNSYHYTISNKNQVFKIVSTGADGELNTKDDIYISSLENR